MLKLILTSFLLILSMKESNSQQIYPSISAFNGALNLNFSQGSGSLVNYSIIDRVYKLESNCSSNELCANSDQIYQSVHNLVETLGCYPASSQITDFGNEYKGYMFSISTTDAKLKPNGSLVVNIKFCQEPTDLRYGEPRIYPFIMADYHPNQNLVATLSDPISRISLVPYSHTNQYSYTEGQFCAYRDSNSLQCGNLNPVLGNWTLNVKNMGNKTVFIRNLWIMVFNF